MKRIIILTVIILLTLSACEYSPFAIANVQIPGQSYTPTEPTMYWIENNTLRRGTLPPPNEDRTIEWEDGFNFGVPDDAQHLVVDSDDGCVFYASGDMIYRVENWGAGPANPAFTLTTDGYITAFALDPVSNTLYFARDGVNNNLFTASSMDNSPESAFTVPDIPSSGFTNVRDLIFDPTYSSNGRLYWVAQYDNTEFVDYLGAYTLGYASAFTIYSGETWISLFNIVLDRNSSNIYVSYNDAASEYISTALDVDTGSAGLVDAEFWVGEVIIDLTYDYVNDVMYMARQDTNGIIYRVDTIDASEYNETDLRQDPTITSIAVALPPQ